MRALTHNITLTDGCHNRNGRRYACTAAPRSADHAHGALQHRALARPFFAKDRISDFDLFEKYAGSTLAILRSLSSRAAPVDVQDLYSRFSLDAAAEFLFGERLDTLHGAYPSPAKPG